MINSIQTPYQLLAQVLEIAESDLHPNSAFGETQNWDSLNHLQLILKLEEQYQISIPNEDIETYTSVAAIEVLYREALARE